MPHHDHHHSSKDRSVKGAVFSATNPGVFDGVTMPSNNEAFMFRTSSNCGTLKEIDRELTGGIGSGPGATFPVDPLGSQGSVTVSCDNKFLFVVNAGDPNAGATGETGSIGTVSSLRIYEDKIKQADVTSSGGVWPVSCTSHKDLLYVLNAGDVTNVTGFRVLVDGQLDQIFTSNTGPTGTFGNFTMVNGQPQPFVSFLQNPTQVSFSPDGSKLVVSVKEYQGGTGSPMGSLYVFNVLPNGQLDMSSMVKNTSSGFLPWGFTFYRDYLVVSEIIGQGVPDLDPTGKSAVSTYKLNSDNTLTPISISIPSGQTSACWVSRSHKYVYVANTQSNTISKYKLRESGRIVLVNAIEVTTDVAPEDMVIVDNKYLYVICSGSGSIQVFKISQDNGKLKLKQTLNPFQPFSGAMGIAFAKFD